ncbi:hypothetical protein C2R22_17670 [Salinigranum rubrum]|uniref:PAS domain-containing protein n=1 Tax=Salinigranum rubrum TaxID=755307 RepID=A0A2I8VMY7_9EURY|nr:PAS domain S-box protein [Salinigranum rubrum]AUV83244.1 hypothetical protein C2R22_17670 [Salinigranum rubrum]
MADYRALAEQDPVGRCVVRDAAVVYVNARFAALTGFDADDLVGRDPRDVFVVDGDEPGEDDDADGHEGGGDADDGDDVRPFLAGQRLPPTRNSTSG